MVSESVSVVLPYFNRRDSLRAAALSVLRQTHQDLRLYLVDDGSTDDSREVARSLADARITHLTIPYNLGACAARNFGMKHASTQLVSFMDSDDIWLPEKLEKQVSALRRAQADGTLVSVIGCGWRQDAHDSTHGEFLSGPFDRQDVLRGVSGTGTPMLLVDRGAAAQNAEFDPTFPAFQDRDFVLTCLSNGSLLYVLPDILVTVARGRGDHVATPSSASAAWERLLSKYDFMLKDLPEVASWYHFRAAREHLVADNRISAVSHFRRALEYQAGRRAFHLAAGLIAGYHGIALAQRALPLH